MNNKEYLNEEKYQQMNKKVNRTGTILLVIGGLMLVSAIIILIIFMGIKKEPTIASIAGPLIVFGIAFLFAGGMTKFMGHTREINAYLLQQQMPIAKEGLEKMAPTVGKVSADVAKEMAPTIGKVGSDLAKEMAPAYKEVAKEISKGIKEGLKEEEK